MITLISTSLSQNSKSYILINHLAETFAARGVSHRVIDLRSLALPLCDGASSYEHPEVAPLQAAVKDSTAVIIGIPVYNYMVGSAAKTMIELVGTSLEDKVVGVVAAAGGSRSYMAPLSFMNSLMLDFRSLVLPRYVYATPDDFTSGQAVTPELGMRLDELAITAHSVGEALASRAIDSWIESGASKARPSTDEKLMNAR